MSTPGRPRRGFLAALQASMAPALPADDGQPLARPRSVLVAGVLVIISGVVILANGLLLLATKTAQLNTQRAQYNDVLNECTTYLGGYGSALPSTPATPTTASGLLAASDLPKYCPQISPADIPKLVQTSGTAISVYATLFLLLGVVIVVVGWFFRDAYRWARRTLIGLALLFLAAAALLGVSTTLSLIGTLLLVVGLVITFIGKAQVFFLLAAGRRGRHA